MFSSVDETDLELRGQQGARDRGRGVGLRRRPRRRALHPHVGPRRSPGGRLHQRRPRRRDVAPAPGGRRAPRLLAPGRDGEDGGTIDHVSNGRFALNVVSGWFKREFHAYGEPWLDHDERYRRAEEFIEVLKGLWTQETFTYRGDFYRIHDAWLAPRPIAQPHPAIYQGGNSTAAREMAARHADWYFMNGNGLDAVREQIAGDARRSPRPLGPRPSVRAQRLLHRARHGGRGGGGARPRSCATPNTEAVRHFAGARRGTRAIDEGPHRHVGVVRPRARWCSPTTASGRGLIGTPEQVAARIQAYHEIGVDCDALRLPRLPDRAARLSAAA